MSHDFRVVSLDRNAILLQPTKFGLIPSLLIYCRILQFSTKSCLGPGALTGSTDHRIGSLLILHQIKDNVRLSISLIDMYTRRGRIDITRQVCVTMNSRTLVSWTSMILGFAINGYVAETLQFFNSMQKEGLEPNGVSFTGALAACSHVGLVDEGLNLVEVMKKVRRIVPTIQHYGCIVDLCSRARRLEDALDVIEKMLVRPNEVVLASLLATRRRTYRDINLVERVTDCLHVLDPNSDSNDVLLSNMYVAAGSWGRANDVRKKMKDLGIQKKAGISSIVVDCNIHEFVAGDKSHAEADKIYAMLEHVCLQLWTSGVRP